LYTHAVVTANSISNSAQPPQQLLAGKYELVVNRKMPWKKWFSGVALLENIEVYVIRNKRY
jgi:hypothetical protein